MQLKKLESDSPLKLVRCTFGFSIPNPPIRSFHSHPRNNKLKPERHSVERIKTICCFNFFVVPLFFLPLFRVHQNNSRIGTKPGGFSWKQNRQIGESTVITVKVDLQNDIIARRRWNFIRCNGSHCLPTHPSQYFVSP